MSFFSDNQSALKAAVSVMGETFTLGKHAGTFKGVFRGEFAPEDYDVIQGHNSKVTDMVTVEKSLFTKGDPPTVDEDLEKTDGSRFVITMVQNSNPASWDLEISKRNV